MRRSGATRTLVIAGAVLSAATATAWDAVTVASARHEAGTDADAARTVRARRPARVRAALPAQAAERSPCLVAADCDGCLVVEVPERAPAEHEVRTLRVVDPAGLAIEGVRVDWSEGKSVRAGTTDARGEIAVPVTGDEAPKVRLFDGWEMQEVVLTEPVATVVVAHLPVLDLVIVDASSGRQIAAPEVALDTWTGAGKHAWKFVPGDGVVRRLPVASDREVDVNVMVTAPAGFGAVRQIDWEGKVAIQARRARVIVPVFPAETWTLQLRDREGRPAEGADASGGDLASAYGAESSGDWCATFRVQSEPSGADGMLVFRGVPRIAVNTATMEILRYPDADHDVTGLRGVFTFPLLDVPAPREPVELVLDPWDGVDRGRSFSSGWG